MPRDLTNRAYLPRIWDDLVEVRLKAMGAVLIEGVKGCGKTATARQIAASEVLLDDPAAVRAAELDPRFVLDGDTPRLLDEWQRTPKLWDAVRRAVDDRGRTGQFILTGSATPRDEIPRHSGAGRFGIVRMRTMTLAEKRATTSSISVSSLLKGEAPPLTRCELDLHDYIHHIAVGGWPQLVGTDEQTSRAFLDGYLDIIVEHDIDEISGSSRNPRLVRRFLLAYAQMVSQPATVNTILKRARDDVDEESSVPSRQTAEPYLDALRRMMIVDEITAWDPSVRSSKRLISTPKRQLGDPSIAAALLGMSSERMLGDLETLGFLFESLVAHDLRVYTEAAGATVFHYREHDARLEVDYVLETRDGDWMGVEVKMGDAKLDQAAQSLKRLAERVARPPRSLVVVTAGSLAYTREDGVHVVPLGSLGP